MQEGSANGLSVDFLTVTFARPVAAGDAVVVSAIAQSQLTTSVTGGGIATWSEITQIPDAGGFVASLWYGLNADGGSNSVTANFSVGDNALIRVTELSGIELAGALDGFSWAGPGGSSAVVSTGTLLTTNATDVLWAMGAWQNPGIQSGPSNGFVDAGFNSQAGFGEIGNAFLNVSAVGSYGTSWTLPAASGGSIGIILALKTGDAGTTGTSDGGSGTADSGSGNADAGGLGTGDGGSTDAGSGPGGSDGGHPLADGGRNGDSGLTMFPPLEVECGCAQGRPAAAATAWALIAVALRAAVFRRARGIARGKR